MKKEINSDLLMAAISLLQHQNNDRTYNQFGSKIAQQAENKK